MTRGTHKPKEIESTQPLDKVHNDLSGIIRTPSIGNFRYFLTFIDDYSRYTTVYLLKSKEEVCDKFVEFKALVENKFERKIKKLHLDSGTEYTNHRFQNVIKESGIEHRFTETDTPQQNGVAKRMNRTIGGGVRSALIDAKLPARYWSYAVQYVVQVRNASPNASLKGSRDHEMPYEHWHGQKPECDRFYPFGSTAIAYNLDAKKK